MRRRILGLHIVQFLFLMDIDQDVPFENLIQARAIDLERLENHIAVAQDHWPPHPPRVPHRLERLRKQPVRKGIIHHEVRHRQQLLFSRLLDAITLQRPQIVGVSEFRAQLLEDFPIALLAGLAHFIRQVPLQILCHAIVVEHSIVHVEEEHGARVGIGAIHTISRVMILRKNSGPIMPEIVANVAACQRQNLGSGCPNSAAT